VARLAYRDVETGDPAGPYGTGTVGSNLQTTLFEVSGLPAGGPLNTEDASDGTGTTVEETITPTGGVDAFVVGGFGSFLDARFGGTPSFTPNGDTTMISNLVANTGMWGVGQPFYGETTGGALTLGGTQGGTTNGSYKYGIVLGAFATEGDAFNWIDAPFSVDGDDATFEYVFDDTITATTGPFWRGTLADSYLIASVTAELAFEDAGSATVLLQAGNEADYSDAATITTLTVSATGSYTADSVSDSWVPTAVYRYWQLVLDSSAQGVHVHEVQLFDPDDGTVGAELDAHLTDTSDAHDASAISVADSGGYFVGTDVEAVLAELGAGQRGYTDHGSAGATEDVSFITAHHRIVLSANLTIDFTGAVSGDSYWTVVDFVGDGAPRTVGYTGSTVTWVGDALDHSGTLDEVVTVVYRTTDGGTNVIAAVSGAGGGSALTVEDEGTPLATAADTLDFVGDGVTASGTGAEKTITIPGVTEASVRDAGRWEVVVSGTAPPVAVSTPGDDDWVYAWVSG
jgi:hypothetical protein